jgi:hypothetical protein
MGATQKVPAEHMLEQDFSVWLTGKIFSSEWDRWKLRRRLFDARDHMTVAACTELAPVDSPF